MNNLNLNSNFRKFASNILNKERSFSFKMEEDKLEELMAEGRLLESFSVNNDKATSLRVFESLQCPICLQLPLPPIFLCENGHIVCSQCQEQTEKCGLCRSNYSTVRNFVAETIVNNLNMKCKFHEDGCTVGTKGSKMMEHQKVCEFRPIICSLCTADKRKEFSFNEIFEHYQKMHDINGYEKGAGIIEYSIPISRFCNIARGFEIFKPFYYRCHGKVFLVQLVEKGQCLCLWVCLLGGKADCHNYEVGIEYSAGTFKLQWRGLVNHFRDDPIVDVFDNSNGLILPLETIRRRCTNTTRNMITWTYNIKIYDIAVHFRDCFCATEPLTSYTNGGKLPKFHTFPESDDNMRVIFNRIKEVKTNCENTNAQVSINLEDEMELEYFEEDGDEHHNAEDISDTEPEPDADDLEDLGLEDWLYFGEPDLIDRSVHTDSSEPVDNEDWYGLNLLFG